MQHPFHEHLVQAVHFIAQNLEVIGIGGGTLLGVSITWSLELFALKMVATAVLSLTGLLTGWWGKKYLIPKIEKHLDKKNENNEL